MNSPHSFQPAELVENVRRQSKRLAEEFHLPLEASSRLLAEVFYSCDSMNDLARQLKASGHENSALALASLPTSVCGLIYLKEHIDRLTRALGDRILTNRNRIALRDTLLRVLGLPHTRTTIADVLPSFGGGKWEPMNIGSDPYAVLRRDVTIQGQVVRLIATRVYLPECFDVDPRLERYKEFAIPDGESIRVIWSSPDGWRARIEVYLQNLDQMDDDSGNEVDLMLPTERLDEGMQAHEAWFASALRLALPDSAGYYGCDDRALLSLVVGNCGYFVFGGQLSSAGSRGSVTRDDSLIRTLADEHTLIVNLDGHPVCLKRLGDWAGPHGGEREWQARLDEQIEHEVLGPLTNRPPRRRVFSKDDRRFYVRPALECELRSALKVAPKRQDKFEVVTVKSNMLSLASTVIDIITAGQAYKSVKDDGGTEYYIYLETGVPHDIDELFISLDSSGSRSGLHIKLVYSTYCSSNRDGKKWAYLNLAPELPSLVASLGGKRLKDALCHGRVMHLPEGFCDDLKKENAIGIAFNTPTEAQTEELVSHLDRFHHSPTDQLLCSFHSILYERDNE